MLQVPVSPKHPAAIRALRSDGLESEPLRRLHKVSTGSLTPTLAETCDMNPVGLDFKDIARHYHLLGHILGRLWEFNCVGGLLAFRTCLLFLGSLLLMAYGIGSPHWPRVLISAAFILFLAGTMAIFRVARLTSICTGAFLGTAGVPSAILNYASNLKGMGNEQRSDYQILLNCVKIAPRGIKVCGVQITYSTIC